MTLPSIETEVRVRYAETDAMGIVHHASYIVWLEIGRTELLRHCGISYREIEAQGLLVVLSDLRVRYLTAARYDDLVTIHTRITTIRSRGLSFHYDLRLSATQTQLIEAQSEHIAVSRQTGRPTRFPEHVVAFLHGKGAAHGNNDSR
jgi:acyl-CoA thioester hydrolase